MLKSKMTRVLAVLVVLFAAYTLAGFFLAPRLVRSLMIDNIQKSLGVTPVIGEIDVNPLRLQLVVHDLLLPAANGARLVGFGRLSVGVQAASIWRRALVFGDIEIDAPFVNAAVGRDGTLNLLQLRPKTPPSDSGDQSPPRIRIGLFKVNRGLLTYEDATREPVFSTRLEPIEFDLHDFSTGDEGGLFDFAATTRNDERIEWHGHVAVAPLESDGDIRLTGLRAATIWEYLEGGVNFAISGGRINVDAGYHLSVKGATELKVNLKRIDAEGVGVRPKGGDADWITVPELRVGPASMDLASRSVEVDSVLVKGMQVTAWQEADHSVNLARLAAAPGATAPGAAAVPAAPAVPAPAPAGGGAAAWRVSLKQVAIDDASLSLEDRSVRPAVGFALAQMSLELKGASLDLSRPLEVKFATTINATAHLGLAGTVTPSPLAADIGLQLAAFDLAALQPYIGRVTGMILQRGSLNADLKVRYGGAKPSATARGNVEIDDLHTVDAILHDDFLNWQMLQLKNVAYQQQPARLEVDQVVVRRLYSRAIIEADSTLNVQHVLSPGTVALAPVPAPVPATTTATAANTATAAITARATARATAKPTMSIAIHKVDIGDSAVNFSDLSINPNFSAGIDKLNGTVIGLSSQTGSRAKVDLKGQVDTFSPVSIAGEVNLLSPALYTDLAMSFRNIELSVINPYSGKFAGYNITKGKLTTELHYKLDGRKLDARHHVTIDQLEFGDRTASKDAVSLPVKLAVALLKDRNGVINLDVPVSGSLDDPQFSILPIIGKVLVNMLEKLITAPFALLGSLFSGGPDLQFVDFHPGSSDLDASADARLKSIARALAERPQLKLEVPIAFVAAIDGPALASSKLAAQLQAAQKVRTGAAPLPVAQLDAAAQLALLHALYVATVGAEPKYPDTIEAVNARADADTARRDFLHRELLGRFSASDSELQELGRQRALALQRALLTDTQLDPERVFLVSSDRARAEGEAVRLEMSLR